MFLDALLQLILALFSGKVELARSIASDPKTLFGVLVLTLLSVCVALVRNRQYRPAIGIFFLGAGLGATPFFTQDASFEMRTGEVFIGGDIDPSGARQEKMTLEVCRQRCLSDGRCVAFTYDQVSEMCLRKGTVSSVHAISGAVSGIRRTQSAQIARP